MSMIPPNALSAAFTPVQRATNDLIDARKIQSQKDFHHTEEVEELDDTAVDSVSEERQEQGHQKNPEKRKRRRDEPEEKVEIAALSDAPVKAPRKAGKGVPRLDISA